MTRDEMNDLSARLYLVQNGVPYGVAMTMGSELRDAHLDCIGRLNGDLEPDDYLIEPPKLTVIDFAAIRAAQADPK